MFKTCVIIGAHREELAFGEKTTKGINKRGIEIIRIPEGIPNKRSNGELKSSKRANLANLYSRIHKKVCGSFDLVIDLHSGLSEEKWGADIFSAEKEFLDFMGAGSKKLFQKKYRLPDAIRLFRIIGKPERISNVFDDRYPVCLAFVPENIINGKHYRYVGLEIYLTSEKGRLSDYRLSRRLLRAVHECAMGYASRKKSF